jgi:acyl-CoA synthetase (AMP-forming)/AMP-acid ligase II
MMPTHITDYLKNNASSYPSKTALVFRDEKLSWAELNDQVKALAAFIAGHVTQDEQRVVCLMMPNSSEFVITYLAIIEAGHIAMPIDVIYKPLEIEAILEQVKPALLIADRASSERVSSATDAVVFEDIKPAKTDYSPLRLAPNIQIAKTGTLHPLKPSMEYPGLLRGMGLEP